MKLIKDADGSFKIQYEMTHCISCDGTGIVKQIKPCPNYDKPMRGIPCPHCGSKTKHGHHYIHTGAERTCETCDGKGVRPETRFDYLPKDWMKDFPIRVFRKIEEHFAYNPAFQLGMGAIFACQDYGRAWRDTDSALIADLRERGGMDQACKISTEAGQVAEMVAVLLAPNGYIVVPVFKEG